MTSKVIAVTGGIGSGKSETVRYLRTLGYNALDCDVLAREVSLRPETAEKVVKLLGDGFVAGGRLDRKKIRGKVFADEALLSQYNKIFFDGVKTLLDERLSVLKENFKPNDSGKNIIFVEISVFDAFDYPWDGVWLVESNLQTRLNRAQKRDGVSLESLNDIVKRQNICDNYTVKFTNDGDLQSLYAQIDLALINFMSI